MLWSNFFSCAYTAGGVSSYQLCRDKQKLTSVSSPAKRPLSPPWFRAVLSQAQPWGRLAAPPYGNGQYEAIRGKLVALRQTPTTRRRGGIRKGGGRSFSGMHRVSTHRKRREIWAARRWKWDRMVQDATARRSTWQKHTNVGCMSDRETGDHGRREEVGQVATHFWWTPAEEWLNRDDQPNVRSYKMCSDSSLRKHLQNVRYCHSALKVSIGKHY